MKYLITGITGSIGAHAAKALLERGDEVFGITHDRHPTGRTAPELLGIQDKLTMAVGDILDQNFMKRVVSDYDVDFILHFAALPLVRIGNMSPVPVWKTNVEGTWNVMEAAREMGSNVLYFDTDKSYGYHGNTPYREDFALNGRGIYDCSKACGDMIARSYHYVFDVPVIVTHSCNIFGPADLNARLIPNSIRRLLKGERPIIYNNINYVREWIYVDNVVSALLTLMDDIGKADGEVYNIGTGYAASQEEVVEKILSHFPLSSAIYEDPLPYMKKEIPYQVLDTSKIWDDFGWEPEVDFDEGLRRTIAWWKDYNDQR